jgi:hypothetical protein
VLFNLVKHSLLFSSETSVISLIELVHLVCECNIIFKGVVIFRFYSQVSGNFTNLNYNKIFLLFRSQRFTCKCFSIICILMQPIKVYAFDWNALLLVIERLIPLLLLSHPNCRYKLNISSSLCS